MSIRPLLLRVSHPALEVVFDDGSTVEDFPPAVVELVAGRDAQPSSRVTKVNQESTDEE